MHALQRKPKDLRFGSDSEIAKALKKTPEIQEKVSTFLQSGKSNNTSKVDFESGDFSGAFHTCKLTLSKDEKGNVTGQLYDLYDFDFEVDYRSKFLIMAANNYAWVTQILGSLNNYNIYVDMSF